MKKREKILIGAFCILVAVFAIDASYRHDALDRKVLSIDKAMKYRTDSNRRLILYIGRDNRMLIQEAMSNFGVRISILEMAEEAKQDSPDEIIIKRKPGD